MTGLLDGQGTPRDFSKTIYCGFNILWLMGFYPEITYLDTEWENTYSLEKAVALYNAYYEMTHPLNEAQKEHINAYLQEISENGQIKEKIEAKVA